MRSIAAGFSGSNSTMPYESGVEPDLTHGAKFMRQCVTSSLPAWLSGDENTQRISALAERLAQYDPAGKFPDPDIVFQQPLHERLKTGNIRRHDFQEVIVTATDVVAFDDLLVLASTFFEFAEVTGPMAAEGHLGKHDDVAAQLLQRDIRAVAPDNADFLKPFRTVETWTLTEADGRGQIDIRTASLVLKMHENLDVELVKGC
jgi:hypothetical protein